MIIRLALLLAVAAAFTACASNKGSARIYQGDSPSIHYSENRETPGGRIENQTFR